ncbi:signal recognition particle-docking protein FtsY [Rhizobium sp. PDO1-076]|uniref:signal recognition particle-docking protein FtsY n=1 Tax=Rhizobium sp. PDO1-076 TaxID=1125979 RepID=UPI00024E3C9E|nr:signal recognition particle-docking protein FtsY [Rhizobium sp. PDO1-076]EHS52025.1 signal recognition particle-docking protein FtsY [Rhizobium sp. PDO1-076]
MALGFIKKVFTFGKEKPAETVTETVEDKALPPEVEAAIIAESEPHDHIEHLPLAEDPVLAREIDTAGGPAPDLDKAQIVDAAEPKAVDDDLAIVPLELLQAEETAEQHASADLEPAKAEALTFHENPVQPADISHGDIVETPAPAEAAVPVAVPVALPKGFATADTMPVEPATEAPAAKLTWFQRLTAGLFRTSSQLTSQITALFTKRKLDEETLEELEDLLIQADLGVETALRVTDTLSSERYGKDVTGEDVTRIMAGEIVKVLKPVAKPLALDLNHKPHVILVVGVNGTGKTTTIGKLAAKLSGSGLKVMLAAGDTFRAAAIEQLKIWADRTGSTFVGTRLGADASGLAYDAFERAKAEKADVLIIDTAGRLQNKTELMAELEKIVRVLGKLDPDAPHTVLQTLDATTGQNAMNQVEIFRNVAGVNGLIMTKLDGTARGGILVAIAAKHKLPVYFIGVGEGVDDLEPFEAEDFASAIAGIAR